MTCRKFDKRIELDQHERKKMSDTCVKDFCCKFTGKPSIDGTISCILFVFSIIGICLLIGLTGGIVSYIGSELDFNFMKIVNQSSFLWFLIGMLSWIFVIIFSTIVIGVGIFCHMHVIPGIKSYCQNMRKEISEIKEIVETEEQQILIS